MKLPQPGEGGTYTPPPAGTFVGVCYEFIDLGTHESEFQGEKKIRREVRISWELGEEMMPDGRPFTVRKKYTWSMHEKATLRHHLEGWRGKAFETEDFGENGFDTRKLIGVPCVLTVTHEVKGDKTFANVASVGKIMRGLQPKPLFNETAYLSLEPGEFDKSVFEKLPDYVKNLIIASPEYAELTKKAPATQAGYAVGFGEPDPSDEIPF